ncbi:unnamed protein product [Danaus chrysippus]|uniref:(African queen) hypothetical protein n=1 Tax=Danaus chrysippus TaxID=151541 RepID=A0A8J2QI52_9NEOP|nr:unnamed protein product [Danaus chrysippus]
MAASWPKRPQETFVHVVFFSFTVSNSWYPFDATKRPAYQWTYAHQINADLGSLPLKDLFENFELATRGEGKNIVSYFTHDTMMEMMFCALGLYKDKSVITGSSRNPDRLWRANVSQILIESSYSSMRSQPVFVLSKAARGHSSSKFSKDSPTHHWRFVQIDALMSMKMAVI